METAHLDPAPLPSGEHPWARALRLWRKGLGFAELVLSIAITIALFVSGRALEWANFAQDHIVSPWLRALVYAAMLAAVYGGLSLPLSFARGYALEKKFGLSTQTLGAWVMDQIKGLLVGALIGAIIVLGLTATIVWFGNYWWIWAALGATLFGIVLTRVAPQLLIPIFFKMKPLEDTELTKRFVSLASRTGTPVLGIYEIDLSRRTKAANAAVVGFGASRRALVGDTLLAKFSPDEIEFVLAHELAHHRYHDLWSGVALSGALTALSLYIAHSIIVACSQDQGPIFEMLQSDFNPLPLFWIAVLASVASAALNPLSRWLSRFMETRADAFAVRTTQHARAGAAAFRKLGYQNLAVFRPPFWEEFLFHTHPCIARRIARLERKA